MRNHRKEQIYASLVAGYWLVKFNNKTIRINPLKRQYKPILEDFFYSSYQEALSKNFLDEEDYNAFLLQEGIDIEHLDHLINNFRERIEDLKVEAFHNFLDPITVSLIKRNIGELKEKINELYNKKFSFYHLSAEGYAEMEKNRFSLALTIYNINNKRIFKISHYKLLSVAMLESIAVELRKAKPTDDEIREIARGDELSSFLSASKKARLFKDSVFDLLEEQVSLINWANLYSSIQSHPEKPTNEVINDNILFDGWLIKQKRINTTKSRQSEVMSTISGNMQNYSNIYLPAKNPEAAKRIYELNLDAERSFTKKGGVLYDGPK